MGARLADREGPTTARYLPRQPGICRARSAIFRCHLGLKIPGEAPECCFTVGPESRSWEEGKVLMFCDAHRHTAVNYTDTVRFIVNFDVIRPK